MEIKYKVEDFDRKLTPCPNKIGTLSVPKVNSQYCQTICLYFEKSDTKKQIVYCGFNKKEVKNEN